MIPQPAYAVGEKYIRIRETGSVFPVHVEQLKMVKKDLADLVEWNGRQFVKVDLVEQIKEEPVKIASSPARKPELNTPPPVVQRTFDAPNSGLSEPPVVTTAPPVTFPAPTITPPIITAPSAVPVPTAPLVQKVDLTVGPPPEA